MTYIEYLQCMPFNIGSMSSGKRQSLPTQVGTQSATNNSANSFNGLALSQQPGW